MIDTAPLPTSADLDPALSDAAQAWKARELEMLRIVAEAAMDLALVANVEAKTTLQSAQTAEDRNAAAYLIRAFDGAARTMRQCMALHDRLIRLADQHKAAQVSKGLDRETNVAARRALVRDVTAAYVETAHKGRHPESERLLADLNETLDSFDDEVFLSTAIGQIARELCVSQGIIFNLGFWERVEEEGYIPHGPGYHGCHLPGEAPEDPWPPP